MNDKITVCGSSLNRFGTIKYLKHFVTTHYSVSALYKLPIIVLTSSFSIGTF